MKTKSLSEKIYTKNTILMIRKKIRMANIDINMNEFLIKRFLLCLVIYGGGIFIPKIGIILAPLFVITFYYFNEYFTLDYLINKRKKKMDEELILFMNTVILSLSNKLNLKNALDITCNHIEGEISFEFKKVLEEHALGKSLKEAINNMVIFIPNQNVINFINILNNSSTENAVALLQNQYEYLGKKRQNNYKIKIFHKAIVIMIIGLISIIITLFLLYVAPQIIQNVTS